MTEKLFLPNENANGSVNFDIRFSELCLSSRNKTTRVDWNVTQDKTDNGFIFCRLDFKEKWENNNGGSIENRPPRLKSARRGPRCLVSSGDFFSSSTYFFSSFKRKHRNVFKGKAKKKCYTTWWPGRKRILVFRGFSSLLFSLFTWAPNRHYK